MSRRKEWKRIFRLMESRHHVEAQVDEELNFLIENLMERFTANGMSEEEARAEIRRRFNGLEATRTALIARSERSVRRSRRHFFLDGLSRDLRSGLRQLRHRPGFAALVTVTIGLGIGASISLFTVVDAVLLRPVPYERPEELINLEPLNNTGQFTIPWAPAGMARVWLREADFVSGMALYRECRVVRTDGDQPAHVEAQVVTVGLASTVGVSPFLGRWFVDEDMVPGALPVVVLSHDQWRYWFAGQPEALGQTIELNGIRHTVIGVMPAGFRFPRVGVSELWIPLSDDNRAVGIEFRELRVVARPQSGVHPEEIAQRAAALGEGIGEFDPRMSGWTAQVSPHDDGLASAGVRQALLTLTIAVVLTWLIVIVNASNLLLMRATAREREMAIRLSLGASRLQLVRQLITESLVLAVIGGALATMLTAAALQVMLAVIPAAVVEGSANLIVMSSRVLWFALALTVLTGLAAGLTPAMKLARRRGPTSVSTGNLYHPATSGRFRAQGALLVTEIGLSVALLVGVGLVINSFGRLMRIEPGFEAENLLILQVNLPEYAYPERAHQQDFFDRLVSRLSVVPGVAGVTLGEAFPPRVSPSYGGIELVAEGGSETPGGQPPLLPYTEVPPNYFEVLGIPLLAGRAFTPNDIGTRNVIIDAGLAQFLWSEGDAVGKHFRIRSDLPWLTVIGVVGDVTMMRLDDGWGRFEVYEPLQNMKRSLEVAVRVTSDPHEVMSAIRAATWDVDPDLPLSGFTTASKLLAESLDSPRWLFRLMTTAGLLALALVVVGVYGALSFNVGRRLRELGVRIALGADRSALRSIVLRRGITVATIGIVLGIAGAIAFSRIIQSVLYDVEPTDPATLVTVSVVMLITTAASSYLPSRRATRVDPIVALKAE